jgi:hypothetical protein
MNLLDYGILVGNPADVTMLEATSPHQAAQSYSRIAGCASPRGFHSRKQAPP